MYIKSSILVVLSVCGANVMAQNNAERFLETRYGLTSLLTGTSLTNFASSLSSFEASLATAADYSRAVSALNTLPASIAASLVRSNFPVIMTTNPPTWFTRLPTSARSVFLSAQSARASVITAAGVNLNRLVSTTSSSLGSSSTGSSSSSSGSSSNSSSSSTTASDSTITASATTSTSSYSSSSSSSSSNSSSTSTSRNAAAKPTGALAVGLAGVVGVLGVVAAL